MQPWTGTARSGWFVVAAGADLVIAVGVTVAGVPVVGFLVIAIAAVLLLFAEVRATVDENGLRVQTSKLAWPSVTIPLADIEEATAIDVRPMRWGGWGYRGSLRFFKRAGWILRAGPGLELSLARGRRFVVTVDDAAAGAAALNARLSPTG